MLARILLFAFLLCGQANATNYYAVCVGINNYPGNDYDLPKCVASVDSFKTILIK